jgi:putative phosphoesterase
MARIAVISDSHGDFRHLEAALAALGKVDYLIHAGDHLRDAERIRERMGLDPSRVFAVVGNCDYPVREPAQALLEIEGVKIFLTHGHHFGVKERVDRLYYRAQELGVRVAIFGHSHIPVCIDDGGVLLLNPGSLTAPRVAEPPSCALLEVGEGQASARILYLAR